MFRIWIHKQYRVNELDNFEYDHEDSNQELLRRIVYFSFARYINNAPV